MNRKLTYFLPVFIAILSLINLLKTQGDSPTEVLAQKDQPREAIQQATPQAEIQASPIYPASSGTPDLSPELSGYCLNVPILMYHHIQPQELAKEKWQTNFSVDNNIFDSQMAYLASSGYTTILVEQLAQSLIDKKPLPEKSIVITLDDGYQDSYLYAFPAVKKYNLKMNLLISTGLLENPDYLTWNQLKEMTGSANVFAYNHTFSHYNIAQADQNKMEFEIKTAEKHLQEKIGQSTKIFAYPYGGLNSNTEKYLKDSGYIAAISTIQGQTQCDSFIMSLHRTRIGNSSLKSYGL